MDLLIVNELRGWLSQYKHLFDLQGYACDTAADWVECVDACGRNHYSAVVISSSLDEFPPEMLAFFINCHVRIGMEPLRFVLHGEMPTGYSEEDLLNFGVVGYIPGHTSEPEMIRTVGEICRRPSNGHTVDGCFHAAMARNAVALHQSLRAKRKHMKDSMVSREERAVLVASLEYLNTRISEQAHTSLISLVTAAEARDPWLRGHIKLVARLSYEIARRMGFKGRPLEIILQGALLHDIGKIGIPDSILNKKSTLSPEERKIIVSHPVIGRKILESNPLFRDYHAIVECHHERLDGSGYPVGLTVASIPIEAQIVAVADVVGALTTDRPYRKNLRPIEALETLYPQRGIKLNADAIDAIRAYIEEEDGRISPSVFTTQDVTLPHFLRYLHT